MSRYDRAIYRWQIHVAQGYTEITAGWADDQILAVAADGDEYVEFWAEVDPYAIGTPRTFTIVGTGHPFDSDLTPIGTTQRTPSGLVWHLMERKT